MTTIAIFLLLFLMMMMVLGNGIVDGEGDEVINGLRCSRRATATSSSPSNYMPPKELSELACTTVHPFLTCLANSVQMDMAALLAFKANISAVDALVDWGISNLTTSPCGWEGVQCSDGLRVSSLNLANRSLSGSISPDLAFLPHLAYLNLSANNFSGGIPAELGLCQQLVYLDLSSNSIRGSIPASFGNLTSLQNLQLQNNFLTGAITPELGNLEKLVEMDLSSNNLTGLIPQELSRLRNLQLLSISMNSFSGAIPPELGQLSNLTHLYAFSCNLYGPLPPHIANLTNLKSLSLESNRFTAAIPPEFGRLKNLCELNLSNNTLEGEIPSTLTNLTDLRFIDVSFNSITGELPNFSANLTHLESIKMANNRLSGIIGSKLSSLSKLWFLSLSNNALTGSIPVSFANHSSLVVLDLSGNQLTGSLPNFLGLCENLRVLLVGYNKLGGPLPSWLWSLGQLQALNLSNNHFTGSLPNSLYNLHGLQYVDWQIYRTTMRNYFNNELYSTFLDVSSNQITGNLPETLGLLNGLAIFIISKNWFSGAIPRSMSNMSCLMYLDLTYNKLTGEIPSELADLTFLGYANFSSNNFYGSIPTGNQFATFPLESYLDNPNLSLCINETCKNVPDDTEIVPIHDTSQAQRGSSMNLKVAIGVACSVALISVSALTFFCIRRRTHVQNDHMQLVFCNELNVTVQDLITATEGYNNSNIIGKGGSSTVYKAVLTDGTIVAVKKLHAFNHEATWRSLVAECKTLGKIRHRNLVKILCTCVTAHLRAILLEYMPNGSLHTVLYESQECSLSLKARFKIARGIAEGLKYLHYDSGFGQVLHLDLKPGNILLDQDFEPHISDFGLSRLVNPGKDGVTLASTFGGSIGYMAPEMGYSDRVTAKADVYSYGVIILELITRKKPTNTPSDWADYPRWIHSFLPHQTMDLIDPQLLDNAHNEEGYQGILSLLKMGLRCVHALPSSRPTMRDIVKELITIPIRINPGNGVVSH